VLIIINNNEEREREREREREIFRMQYKYFQILLMTFKQYLAYY